MSRLYHLLAVILFFSAAGCAGTKCYIPAEAESGRDITHVKGIRVFEQDKDRCGPAAMASMLVFSGVDIRPEDLEEMVYDPESRGSLQISLVASARRHGRVAYEIKGIDALSTELSAGYPVLVLLNKGFSWWPVYHYAVVTGFDQNEEFFILAGGLTCEEQVPGSLFRRMWRRAEYWGLMVLAPDDIPFTAEPVKWVKAVYELERIGDYEAALSGYTAALEKWPKMAGAMMGRANSLYSLGRIKEAGGMLNQAAAIHPESGPILNNLAHVMLELGELEAAFEAAARAVKIAGPHAEACRKTLKRVREAMDDGAVR